MKKVGFVYDEACLLHDPGEWHPESRQRLTCIVEGLKTSGLWNKVVHLHPRLATIEDLTRVHEPAYIETIRTCGPTEIDDDTIMSADSFEAALHAAGGVLEAVDLCRRGETERAFCAVRPPGHHAGAATAMGFCIVNNVAVAARYAQTRGYRKIFIVDFDAHHGNGTQDIFWEDDTVFYFSAHQHPLFPFTGKDMERGEGRGEGFTYNVTFPAGSGNRDYLAVFQEIYPSVLHRFSPDLILVSAGYDILAGDTVTGVRVTRDGIRGIVHGILAVADSPAIFVLEGGYDLHSLSDAVNVTIEEMLTV